MIRNILPNDLHQVIQLSESIVKEVGRKFYNGTSPEKLIDAVNNYSFVSVNQGKIDGFQLVLRCGEAEYICDGGVVHKDARGNSLHKKIMQEVISNLKSIDSSFLLIVGVHPDNERSIKSLKGAGFKEYSKTGKGDSKRLLMVYEN